MYKFNYFYLFNRWTMSCCWILREKKKSDTISNCKANFCWESITFIYLVPLVCGALRDCSSVLPCQQALVMCQLLSAYCRGFGNQIPNGNVFFLKLNSWLNFALILEIKAQFQSQFPVWVMKWIHDLCVPDTTDLRLLLFVCYRMSLSSVLFPVPDRCVFVQRWPWCDSWFNMMIFILCALCTLVECVLSYCPAALYTFCLLNVIKKLWAFVKTTASKKTEADQQLHWVCFAFFYRSSCNMRGISRCLIFFADCESAFHSAQW